MKAKFLACNRGMAKIWTILIVVLSIVLSAGIGTFLGTHLPGGLKNVTNVFTPPFGGKKVLRILVLGEDNTARSADARGLSDTIMLVNLNLESNEVSMLSIPRDTRILLDGYGYKKINAAYKLGGPQKTKEVVSLLTGIQPDYYVKTNVTGFKKTVDLIGGVEIDVEKNMHYTDHWGGLFIDLKKGRQLLNGEKAMQYVRFRHDAMGDIWRVERQQKFFVALGKKMIRLQNLPKLPQIVQSINKNVETDFTLKDMYALAKLPGKLDVTKAKTATLPGAPESTRGGFWVPDQEKTAKVVQDLFFTTTLPGLPKVEVLNGSGEVGAAQTVADALKLQGYEVISTGNADSFKYPSSRIVTHKKDLKGADALAKIVNTVDVKFAESQSAAADVTVIVGKDCALLANQGG